MKEYYNTQEWSEATKIINTSTWLLVIFQWVYTLINYSQLPETIATHFNHLGQADGFGSKKSVLLLPLISTFAFIILLLVTKYPKFINYPVKVSEFNIHIQQKLAVAMIRNINLILALTSSYICYAIVEGAKTSNFNLGQYFVVILLFAFLVPIAMYFYKALKNENR